MNNILAIRKEQLPDNIEELKNFIIKGFYQASSLL